LTGTSLTFSTAATQNGNTHSTTTIDNLTSTAGLSAGMGVSGSGVPSGATIATIVSSTSVTISSAATSTSTATPITFYSLATTTSTGVPLTLNGGNFTFLGKDTVGVVSSDTIGSLTLTAGNSTITSTTGAALTGATVQLTAGTLTRTAGATVIFSPGASGNNLGSTYNQVKFNTTPAMTNGIWPWAPYRP